MVARMKVTNEKPLNRIVLFLQDIAQQSAIVSTSSPSLKINKLVGYAKSQV